MTPEQVQIIKLTFAQVINSRQDFGRLFYDRLFEVAPQTRVMFGDNIDTQARKLTDMLALAVGTLRDMPTLIATLEGLARRHTDYGVRDEHYDIVGQTLLWTLEKTLGAAFTPTVRETWTALYGAVAQIMRNAVASAHRPASQAVAR